MLKVDFSYRNGERNNFDWFKDSKETTLERKTSNMFTFWDYNCFQFSVSSISPGSIPVVGRL